MTIALRTVVPACLCVFLIGCQTVASTIPFGGGGRPDYTTLPEAEMRQAAAAIERMVASGDRDAALPVISGVTLDTEPIQHAIRTRTARVHLVEELRVAGYAWEKREGLLHLRGGREYSRATTRRERDRHGLVIYSENQNRWELYEGIVRANNLSRKSLDAVKAIFADARVQAMGSGQMYEDANGEPAFTR